MMVPAWTETCGSDSRNFVLIFLWFYNCVHQFGIIKNSFNGFFCTEPMMRFRFSQPWLKIAVLWDTTPRCFRVANASRYVLPPSSRQKSKHSVVNVVLIQRKGHQDRGLLWGADEGWWRQVTAIKSANTRAGEDKGMFGGGGDGREGMNRNRNKIWKWNGK